MRKRCVIVTTVAFAAAGVLSACSGNDPAPPSPTPAPSLATPAPTAATPTPTPVLTPTPTVTLDAGQAEAAAVVERYVGLMDRIAADRTIPLDSLYEAASGEAARGQLRALQQLHVNEFIWTGTTAVEIRDVTGEDASYDVEACLDTSAIEVVDQEGRSVAAPDEPATTLWRYTVQDISGRLLVMEEEAIAQPC